MKTAFCFSLFACILGLHSLGAADTPAPPEYSAVREFIQKGIAESRSPSVAVAVVRDDRIIWAEGFGLADVEAKRPATSDSIYLLASVSKPIAATGLMRLVEEGKIQLDKPANDCLPNAKLTARVGKAEDITVRRLLNHTSGMPVHANFYRDGIAPPTRDETIRRYGFAHRPPGSRYEYCNLGYGIIDYITSLSAGTSWREFMDAKLYDPLGMTHTSDRVRPGLQEHATAQYRYDIAGRFVRVSPYGFDHDGASAVWSSANDLARFLRLHLNDGLLDGKRFFREGTLRAMQQLNVPREGEKPSDGYGLGLLREMYMGHASYGHTGSMPGVSTRIRAFPDDKAAYVVLTNASASGLLHAAKFRDEIGQRITRALFADATDPPPFEEPAKPKPVPPGGFKGTWKGILAHFDGDIPLKLEVAEDGAIEATFASTPTRKLGRTSFANSLLSGETEHILNIQPSHHGTVIMEFRLRSDGDDSLSGICVARSEGYFAVSHWVKLERVKGPSTTQQ